MIKELFTKPVVVLGCGNTLYGDDGFGPEVIDHLHRQRVIPETVLAEDVGTSVRELLFDLLLSPQKPARLIIVDATDRPEMQPGELCELAIEDIGENKTNDFSVHQFPSLNLLAELSSAVEVSILAVRVANIPSQVQPGLSPAVAAAVPQACDWIMAQVGEA
jgi:coenzyme F420 hydrogenase subunit delta